VSDLNVDVALGRTTVTLPGKGGGNAKVEGAIGEIVVIIPEGMEARIQASVPLGSRALPDGYQRQEDVYTSPGYARADDRVDLDVSLAIGSIRVRHAQ